MLFLWEVVCSKRDGKRLVDIKIVEWLDSHPIVDIKIYFLLKYASFLFMTLFYIFFAFFGSVSELEAAN